MIEDMNKQTLALIILGTVDWILVCGLRFIRYTPWNWYGNIFELTESISVRNWNHNLP